MLTEGQKRDFCAILLKNYGVQIDVNNELLPVFFVAYQSALITENSSRQSGEHIQKIINDFEKETASKLEKMQVSQFHFQSTKQAFWFAYGKYGLLASIVAILCFAVWIFKNYPKENRQVLEQSSFLLTKSPVTQKKLNDSISAHLITLYPAKNLTSALAGKHYVYRKECQCIDIPLYFENQAGKK